MVHQVVHGKHTSPLEGVFLVLGIMVGLALLTAINNIVNARMQSPIFPAIIYILAILCAIRVMRSRVREYHYTVHDGTLYLERVFGSRTSILLQIPTLDIVMQAEPQAVRERYPKARVAANVTVRACPIPERVIAFRQDAQIALVRMQPNEEILRAITVDPEDRARRNRDKWG